MLHCTAREVPDLQEAFRKWQLNLTCKRFWETSPVSRFKHLLSENTAECRKLFLIPPASPALEIVKFWLVAGTLPVPRSRTGGYSCSWTGWRVCPAALGCEREVLCPQRAGPNPPTNTTSRKERASHLPVTAALLQPFYLLSCAITCLLLSSSRKCECFCCSRGILTPTQSSSEWTAAAPPTKARHLLAQHVFLGRSPFQHLA